MNDDGQGHKHIRYEVLDTLNARHCAVNNWRRVPRERAGSPNRQQLRFAETCPARLAKAAAFHDDFAARSRSPYGRSAAAVGLRGRSMNTKIPGTFGQRLRNAALRRLSAWQRLWLGHDVSRTPVERAWQWLAAQSQVGYLTTGLPGGEVVATAAALAAAVQYGERRWIATWLRFLRQRLDASIVGPARGWNGLPLAAQLCILRNFLAAEESFRASAATATLANAVEISDWIDRWGPPTLERFERTMYALPAVANSPAVVTAPAVATAPGMLSISAADLLRLAKRCGDPAQLRFARDFVVRQLERSDSTKCLNEDVFRCIEGWWLLGQAERARAAFRQVAAEQAEGGGVIGQQIVDSFMIRPLGTTNARVAWRTAAFADWAFRIEEWEAGSRAMAFLYRNQDPDGGFGDGGDIRNPADLPVDLQAVLAWLRVVPIYARGSFDRQVDTLPGSIDADDPRLGAIEHALRPLFSEPCISGDSPITPTSRRRRPRIAEVGCGSGRMIRALAARLPDVDWIGIDISTAMLERLPDHVERRLGGLLSIPAANGEFDAVVACESLEHALLPAAAVAEMGRVTCPGGVVVIVDKCQSRQELSQLEPWERWFRPSELIAWLGSSVGPAEVRRLAANPLFLAATARRSGGAADRKIVVNAKR